MIRLYNRIQVSHRKLFALGFQSDHPDKGIRDFVPWKRLSCKKARKAEAPVSSQYNVVFHLKVDNDSA